MDQHTELLSSLLAAKPDTRVDLVVAPFTHSGIVLFVVALRSGTDLHAITIGKGLTRDAALLDATTCLRVVVEALEKAIADPV
jgi:hypothetical protein